VSASLEVPAARGGLPPDPVAPDSLPFLKRLQTLPARWQGEGFAAFAAELIHSGDPAFRYFWQMLPVADALDKVGASTSGARQAMRRFTSSRSIASSSTPGYASPDTWEVSRDSFAPGHPGRP